MKVLILGGGGEMGRYACVAAAGDPAVDELTIADRNAEAAGELADRLGDKAVPMELDVTDAGALADAIGGTDIVLNTVGPFHRWGQVVLEAAIEGRKSYADINDDWQPTVEALELGDRAAEAGVTAIVGLGASPGISNMLAAVAMRELDQVDRVLTGWRTGGLPKPPRRTPTPRRLPRASTGFTSARTRSASGGTGATPRWIHSRS
jgi:saccharopine dehydrogenase-like NADP-dependent oxidoreductase